MGRQGFDPRDGEQRRGELSGAIFDERERQAAIVAAENVAGVKAVEDGLFCADPMSVLLVS